MNYRLNYKWLEYEEGSTFKADEYGYIKYRNAQLKYKYISKDAVNLLLLSGALSEVVETKDDRLMELVGCKSTVELPEELNISELCKYSPQTTTREIASFCNQLRAYLSHSKEK